MRDDLPHNWFSFAANWMRNGKYYIRFSLRHTPLNVYYYFICSAIFHKCHRIVCVVCDARVLVHALHFISCDILESISHCNVEPKQKRGRVSDRIDRTDRRLYQIQLERFAREFVLLILCCVCLIIANRFLACTALISIDRFVRLGLAFFMWLVSTAMVFFNE